MLRPQINIQSDMPIGGASILRVPTAPKKETIVDKAVGIVDYATSLPKKIKQSGDNLNDAYIRMANDLKKIQGQFSERATETAEKNIVSQKVGSIGSKIAIWIKDNIALAGAGFAGLIVLFVILKKI